MTALSEWIARALRGVVDSRWGVTAAVGVWAVFFAVFSGTPSAHAAGNSDGHYEWLYARSLAYDQDVDFTNDYKLCGDPFQKGSIRKTGHPDNPYYVGAAVIWVPVLSFFRLVDRLPAEAPEQDRVACTGSLVQRTLAVGPLLGALIVWLMYRVARRFATDGPAALAAGLLGVASQLPAYASIMTSYSHVHDAFWSAMTLLLAIRASERPQSITRWVLAGICVGIGLLQRPVSIVYGVVPFALAVATLWRRWGLLAGALVALGLGAFAFGVLPWALLYRYLYGAFVVSSPGQYRFFMQYAHAHPWLVLFAPHGGLFYTAPSAWLAVPGIVLGLRSRQTRVLVAALLVACVAVTWLSGAAIDWHGSGAFGARRLTSLIPLLVVPAALTLAAMHRRLRKPSRARTLLGVALIVPLGFTIVGAAYAMGQGRIPTEAGSSQADLYGTGEQAAWGYLDQELGDVSILPAELIFKLRFGLPMRSFRDATEPLYQRNILTLAWERNEIDLKGGHHDALMTGFQGAKEGAHLVSARGTVVFAAQWPNATDVAIGMRAVHPARVRVGRALAFGRTERWGEATATPDAQTLTFTIPSGGFESGVFAVAIECDDPSADVLVSSLKIGDATVYEAAP